MKQLNIIRFCYAPTGTFGYAQSENGVLYTVERPWLSNAHGISCIPEGTFTCAPRFFHKDGYNAVEVKGVPNRQDILIHIANVPKDVEGCIGVGRKLGILMGDWAVLDSKLAFEAFMAEFGSEPFQLTISQIKGATL